MDVVFIERKTFEMMLERFEKFADRIETLCNQHADKALKEWLDNQEVCQLLNISKRALQTYRDNGTLSYTLIGRKIFYKPEDLEKIIEMTKVQ